MLNSRKPKIGDLIVEHVDEDGTLETHTSSARHIGIITEILLDKYGFQRHVMIEWCIKPKGYSDSWGYCGTNISNQYKRFSIIRKGTCL